MLKSLNKKMQDVNMKYDNLEVPVWIIDDTLNVVFSNKLAQKKYPSTCKIDYFRTNFSANELENMAVKITSGIPFSSSFDRDGNDEIELMIIPFKDEDRYDSAYIFLAPKGVLELDNGGDNPYGLSVLKSSLTFANNLYGSVCDILYSLSDMSDKLQKVGINNVDDQIGNITHECYKVIRMTENLRLRLGMFEENLVVYKAVDFWNTLAELLDATNTVLTAAGLQFEYSLPQSTVNVECIFKKVSAAILNIISNAFQFSNCKAKVRLIGRDTEDAVLITISDNGPGISSKVQEHLFQPFVSWSDERNAPVGLGLGLNIARNTLYEMGGTIIVDSSKNGTIVAMSIPKTGKIPNEMPLFSMQEEYLQNRFSQLYISLSDIIVPPKL